MRSGCSAAGIQEGVPQLGMRRDFFLCLLLTYGVSHAMLNTSRRSPVFPIIFLNLIIDRKKEVYYYCNYSSEHLFAKGEYLW